jgi:DNA primase
MSKSIPQQFIDGLLSRVDIVDIVSSRIKLRRTGSNLVGLCPFHTEKTPSFTVSQNKQFFHCFGCGAHGSAIGFIMQFERVSFVEAVENLATQIGLTVPKTSSNNSNVRFKELYQTTEKAAAFFVAQLPRSSRAITYLKSRGLTGEICKRFKIGYAPNDWENLRSLYTQSPFIKQQMIDAGILIAKDHKTYSRFRDRIMFPIYDTRGHVIGFGGRAIDNDPAKYLNSPETPIFHKGEELYGLYEARIAERNLKSIIVVEGYLDVCSLAQFNITNVVAALGTAISTKQVQLLLRNSSEIIFCFDGDEAGRRAAWRALENSLPLMREGIQIRFLFLPENDDPDSLIRKESKEKFLKRLEGAIPLSDFFINHLSHEANLNTIDGKAKFVKTSKGLLKRMPQGIFYQLLSKKIADKVNINVEELKNSETNQNSENEWLPKQAPLEPPLNQDKIPNNIQNSINILLHYPELIVHIDNIDELKGIRLNGVELLLDLINLLKNQQNISMGAILEYWRDRKELEIINKLACKEPIISKEGLKNELIDIIQSLKQLEREKTIKDLLARAATQKLNPDERKELQNLIETSKK